MLVQSRPGSKRPVYRRAGAVQIGDTMWVVAGAEDGLRGQSDELEEAVVESRHVVVGRGLYAPFTLSGTIIVNGVAASVHR